MTIMRSWFSCLVLAPVLVSPGPSRLWAEDGRALHQVEVEVQFVEFRIADIEPISARGFMDMDALLALRRKGKGQLLSAPKLVTLSGTEASVKVVTECMYPTELKYSTHAASGTNIVAKAGQFAIIPASFETREVGVILSVLPELRPGTDLIDLSLTPELVTEPTWKSYKMTYTDARGKERKHEIELPFFHTRSINSTVALVNGATILLGGGGWLPGADKEPVLYVFLTARLVDPAGRPINPDGTPR